MDIWRHRSCRLWTLMPKGQRPIWCDHPATPEHPCARYEFVSATTLAAVDALMVDIRGNVCSGGPNGVIHGSDLCGTNFSVLGSRLQAYGVKFQPYASTHTLTTRAPRFRSHEQPLELPQFTHLWQLPLRIMSDPQVTQSGASPTS